MSSLQLIFIIFVKREDDQNKFIVYVFIRNILFVCVCVHISSRGLYFGILAAQEIAKDTIYFCL